MNWTSKSVRGLVELFARWINSKVPEITLEDAEQELWVEVMNARQKFSVQANTKFETFIYSHLKYRASNMVSSEISRRKRDRRYANGQAQSYCLDEQSLARLCESIHKRLTPFDRKIFKALIDPSDDLLRMTRNEANRPYEVRSNVAVSHQYLMMYFHATKRDIIRSMRRIKLVVRSVLTPKGE